MLFTFRVLGTKDFRNDDGDPNGQVMILGMLFVLSPILAPFFAVMGILWLIGKFITKFVAEDDDEYNEPTNSV